MATLDRSVLPSWQEIQDQRLSPAQIQAVELEAVRQRDLARLDRPDSRPRTLERESVILLQAIHRRLAGIAATCTLEIEPYLDIALLNLHQAVYEAARPYLDLSAKPLRAERTDRIAVLPATQVRLLVGLRDGSLRLLTATAPVTVALSLIRVTDWLDLAVKVTERQERRADQRLLSESDATAFVS